MIAQHAADLSPSLFACNAWMLVWLCPVAWKEWMRREREAATRQLEEEAAENVTSEPLRMDYRTLAALPSSGSQRVNRTVSDGC